MNKQWPKCQTNPAACEQISVPASAVRFPGTNMPNAGVWTRATEVSDARRVRDNHVQYTRTDIAEARIAELEAERDALQRRIDNAPVHTATRNGVIRTGVGSFDPGQRVALVVLP